MFIVGVINIIVIVKNVNNEVLGMGDLVLLKCYLLYLLVL